MRRRDFLKFLGLAPAVAVVRPLPDEPRVPEPLPSTKRWEACKEADSSIPEGAQAVYTVVEWSSSTAAVSPVRTITWTS